MHMRAHWTVIALALLMTGCLVTCYLVGAISKDTQWWIPYISDIGFKGLEKFIFTEVLNCAAFIGMVMMLTKNAILQLETNDTCINRLRTLGVCIGLLSTFSLTLEANFQEQVSHGIGTVHMVGAALTFGGGSVYAVFDSTITYMRTRASTAGRWYTSVRWYEWLRPVFAAVLCVSLILFLVGHTLSTKALDSHGDNTTHTRPHKWYPDEEGYTMHVTGALCEWLMGLAFVLYCLTFVPEFRPYLLHVRVVDRDEFEAEAENLDERTALLGRSVVMYANAMRMRAHWTVIALALLMTGCLTTYLLGATNIDQCWIPLICDTEFKKPEKYIFREVINCAAFTGMVMMLTKNAIVQLETNDTCINRLRTVAVCIGLLSFFGLTLEANFQEQLLHGISRPTWRMASNLLIYGGGVVYAAIDSTITYLKTRASTAGRWYTSVTLYEWLRAVFAGVSLISLILFFVGYGNWTNTVPWYPDEGYEMHVTGTLCGWLMALAMALYCLTFVREFREYFLQLRVLRRIEFEAESENPDQRATLLGRS